MSNGSTAMNNPLEILRTLDRRLSKQTKLTIFGRSALALGYPNPPPDFEATHDVDAIIPVAAEEPDLDFWIAQRATNADLENSGLYITHLFSELDVILQPDWQARRVALSLALPKLSVFRPATIDLILTKMARGDEQDMEDVRFLLGKELISAGELQAAFARARVPDVEEIRQLFLSTQPKVLRLAVDRLE
jgi:Nucleotidyltransferase of unknown function (DUF6036)